MKRLFLIATLLPLLAGAIAAQGGALGDLTSGASGGGSVPVSAPVSVSQPSGTAAAAPAAEREWLVMVFINGVNDLGLLGAAANDINEMEAVGSSDAMAVVVEYGILSVDAADRGLQFPRGSKTLYITRDDDAAKINSPVIFSSNDADMGSEANLVRFAKRAIRRYPAKKAMLVLWNHGDGRLGISFDDVSRNHMEIDRLGRALGQIKTALGKNLAVFATDACLMQMAGVAYEFKDAADVVVGSQEIIQTRGYPYTAILSRLAADPGMGPEGLGGVIVDSYIASYASDATLSAIRTAALPSFLGALHNWLGALRSDPRAWAAATSPDTVDSVSHFDNADSKDLVDYVDKVSAAVPEGSPARSAGAALKQMMRRGLFVHSGARPAARKPYTAANGLAIYVPDLRYHSANYEKFAFAADSYWDDFLRDMMEERLKRPSQP